MVDDYDFLVKNNIYYAVPWIMGGEKYFGSARVSNSKAIAAGLTFRPLIDTVKDTYNWWNSDAITEERRQKYESNPNALLVKEKALLENWKAVK
jgi:2'-hydroxyisoflavone reductase